MTHLSAFSRACLLMQGYPEHGDDGLARLNLPLRFTPTLCLLGTMAATLTRSPILFSVLAVFALIGWVWPAGHPFDVLFNRVLRPILRIEPLPPNPAPRRSAFLMSLPLLAGAGLAFELGLSPVGYAAAALLIAGCSTYVLSGLCIASWLYRATVGRSCRSRSDGPVHS